LVERGTLGFFPLCCAGGGSRADFVGVMDLVDSLLYCAITTTYYPSFKPFLNAFFVLQVASMHDVHIVTSSELRYEKGIVPV